MPNQPQHGEEDPSASELADAANAARQYRELAASPDEAAANIDRAATDFCASFPEGSR